MSRYIDADALIMALRLEYPMIPMFKENRKEWEIKTDGYRKAEEVINDAPTIEPKRGEWIEIKRYWEINQWVYEIECSVCKERIKNPYEPHFCPNCGADMRKESE